MYDPFTPQSAERMFRALGQPVRRRIMEALAQCPMSLMTLCEYAGVSQSTVSYHVEVLREAGLVSAGRGGMCVDKEGLCGLIHYINGNLMH